MARILSTVEDTFAIRDRGLVFVPGIIPEGKEKFQIGDPILLKRPDGSTLQTKIGGLELIQGGHLPPREDVAIFLKGMNKEDVPIGTEVWSVDSIADDDLCGVARNHEV